jgi:phage shock protein C
MAEGARFCSNCGCAVTQAAYVPVQPRLERPRHGRVIAGVCAGFAQRYGWDVVLVRLVLVLVVLCGAGTPLLAYLIAWIVIPNGQYALPQTIGGMTS